VQYVHPLCLIVDISDISLYPIILLNNCRITTIYHIHYSAISAISTGWWFGTFGLFFHILGMSSSQLTHIFQRGWNHHQPAIVMWLYHHVSTISWTIVTILNYSNYRYILNYPQWSIPMINPMLWLRRRPNPAASCTEQNLAAALKWGRCLCLFERGVRQPIPSQNLELYRKYNYNNHDSF